MSAVYANSSPRPPLIVLIPALFVYAALMLVTMLATMMIIAQPSLLLDPLEFIENGVEGLNEPEVITTFGILTLITIGLQCAFLAPMVAPIPARQVTGRSMLLSVIAAGFMASIIVLGAFGVMISAAALVHDVVVSAPPDDSAVDIEHTVVVIVPMVVAVGFGWPLFVVLFRAATRRDQPERAITRLARWLAAGTAIEFLVAIPVDVMVRRRTDCYCSTSSFFALSFAMASGFFLAGPGLLIPLLARRARRRRVGRCPECGYDRHLAADRPCSECGATESPDEAS